MSEMVCCFALVKVFSMNRSQFIKSIALGLAGIISGPTHQLIAMPNKANYVLGEMPVAGYKYYKGESIEHLMQTGDALLLVREPDNKFDASAIALHYGEIKIGYLPRVENSTISRLLDQNAPVTATITDLDPDAEPWERVWVEVRMGIKIK